MQHAFALNSNDTATNAGVADQPTHSQHCHTSIIDGFRVDKDTAEIYGRYVASPLLPSAEQYRDGIPYAKRKLHLVNVRQSDNVVHVDFMEPTRADPTTDANITITNTNPKRGPRPKVLLNQYAAIVKVAIAENAHWIENAVMAGMYIAVESSNGKLNIRPGYVRKVLTMAVISTEAIRCNPVFRNHDFEPVSERYARYLAAAGRVALRNVERYLDAHPAVLQRLEAKVLEPTVWGEEFDLDEADYVEGPYGTAA